MAIAASATRHPCPCGSDPPGPRPDPVLDRKDAIAYGQVFGNRKIHSARADSLQTIS